MIFQFWAFSDIQTGKVLMRVPAATLLIMVRLTPPLPANLTLLTFNLTQSYKCSMCPLVFFWQIVLELI